MSTQLIGFSIGGFVRRYLVAPPSMSKSALDRCPFVHLLLKPVNL
jgi:hypothetical protein